MPKFCDKPHGSFVSEDSRDVASRDRRRRKRRTEQYPQLFSRQGGIVPYRRTARRVTASYILLIVQMRDVSRTHHRTFESPPSGTAGAIRHFAVRHRTQDVQASGAFQQSKRSGAAIAAPLRCRIVRMTAPRVFSNSTPHRRPVSWPDYPRSHRFSTPRRRRSYRIRGNRRDSPENRGNRRSSVPWQPCCRRPPPR